MSWFFWFTGEMSQKRKRGRPPKKETLARRQAEREEAEEKKAARAKLAQSQQAEEEEDELVDAGAIEDHEGRERADSEMNREKSKNHIFTSCLLLLVSMPSRQRLRPGGAGLQREAGCHPEETLAVHLFLLSATAPAEGRAAQEVQPAGGRLQRPRLVGLTGRISFGASQ